MTILLLRSYISVQATLEESFCHYEMREKIDQQGFRISEKRISGGLMNIQIIFWIGYNYKNFVQQV